MIRGLEKAAKNLNLDYSPKQQNRARLIDSIERVPMMYRAQVSGRCKLQYGKENKDLDRWTVEWVAPDVDNHNQPKAQLSEPLLGLDGDIYRMKETFPWRVFTNGGEDSILRPAIGKDGIPIIPGSSIKGLFERLARSHPNAETQQEIRRYCGDADHQGLLRFHGAYPVGDWAGTTEVEIEKDRQSDKETRYRMVDVVHPQQARQVGTEQRSPQAIATVSFFEPTLIFELSCQPSLNLDEAGWEKVRGLLRSALRAGLGGKTSSGYGLRFLPQDRYALNIRLSATGVSSLLRSNEPEFRPNLFKATLRGHASRLLGGVCDDERKVQRTVDRLFGGTQKTGSVSIYWDMPSDPVFDVQGTEKTPVYRAMGTLRIDAKGRDLSFCKQLMLFTYLMAGLGKSWRRVWHAGPDGWQPGFMNGYTTRAIGCHWKGWDSEELEMPRFLSVDELTQFLQQLRASAQQYLGLPKRPTANECLNWRESWHPKRVAVYAAKTSGSQVVGLFHDDAFKTTKAIGGKEVGDNRPKAFSCVWHRVLPVEDEYLEIVTLFHGNRRLWKREGVDQLRRFRESLEGSGFRRAFGRAI